MAQDKLTGLRKRQQIKQANRTMFFWVVGASVVASVALVAAQFLVSQMLYNGKVAAEKRKTSETLKQNIVAAEELKTQIAVLNDSSALRSVRANSEDTNLQVVIDALPTKEDALALGSSLQLVVLPKASVTIESLTVGESSLAAAADDTTAPTADGASPLPFNLIFSGNVTQVKDALLAMERTIRPIHIDNLMIEGSDSNLKVTVIGKTFYQPPKTLEMQQKVIKR